MIFWNEVDSAGGAIKLLVFWHCSFKQCFKCDRQPGDRRPTQRQGMKLQYQKSFVVYILMIHLLLKKMQLIEMALLFQGLWRSLLLRLNCTAGKRSCLCVKKITCTLQNEQTVIRHWKIFIHKDWSQGEKNLVNREKSFNNVRSFYCVVQVCMYSLLYFVCQIFNLDELYLFL